MRLGGNADQAGQAAMYTAKEGRDVNEVLDVLPLVLVLNVLHAPPPLMDGDEGGGGGEFGDGALRWALHPARARRTRGAFNTTDNKGNTEAV